MKVYNNVDEYIKEAKQNDIIVLGGKGLMDGIKSLESKHDTHKVVIATEEKFIVRAYKGRTNLILGANGYDQEIAVLSSEEFKKLPVLW